MILSPLGSQGTTQNDVVEQLNVVLKTTLGKSQREMCGITKVPPKDNLRQHQVSPQKNFTLPQVQSHVCLWTSLACPKSQAQNPMAWFVNGIGKLNPSPLGWLSHPHHHGASPWCSQGEAHPMQDEFARKGTSFALYHPPQMNISIDKTDIWQSKGLNLFRLTHQCEMNTT